MTFHRIADTSFTVGPDLTNVHLPTFIHNTSGRYYSTVSAEVCAGAGAENVCMVSDDGMAWRNAGSADACDVLELYGEKFPHDDRSMTLHGGMLHWVSA